MSTYTAPQWASTLFRLVAYMTEEFGGGPKVLKMAWVSRG